MNNEKNTAAILFALIDKVKANLNLKPEELENIDISDNKEINEGYKKNAQNTKSRYLDYTRMYIEIEKYLMRNQIRNITIVNIVKRIRTKGEGIICKITNLKDIYMDQILSGGLLRYAMESKSEDIAYCTTREIGKLEEIHGRKIYKRLPKNYWHELLKRRIIKQLEEKGLLVGREIRLDDDYKIDVCALKNDNGLYRIIGYEIKTSKKDLLKKISVIRSYSSYVDAIYIVTDNEAVRNHCRDKWSGCHRGSWAHLGVIYFKGNDSIEIIEPRRYNPLILGERMVAIKEITRQKTKEAYYSSAYGINTPDELRENLKINYGKLLQKI